MSRPDATAAAALDAEFARPVFLAFLDFAGDSLRANTGGANLTPIGTGDADLDGNIFDGIKPNFIEFSPVRIKDGGSEPVTATLSGIVGIDTELLAAIGDEANWKGRTARLWRIIRDASGVQQGGIQHYYTGYMVALAITGSPASQTITMTIESYLAALSQASNRTYLDQDLFDPDDQSARATIALANGMSGSPLVANTPGGGGGGGIPAWKTMPEGSDLDWRLAT